MAYGTYEGGIGTAASDPINVPSINAPAPGSGGDFGGMGDMGQFMKQMLMEQYERKKREQAESDRLRTLAEIQAREYRARALAAEQEQAKQAQIARMGQQGQRNAMRGGGGQSLMGGEGGNSLDREVRNAQATAEIERLQSLGRPAPTRMVYGAGILAGPTLDTMAMNAYQREAFLPKGSSDVMPTAGPGGQSATMNQYDAAQAQNAKRRPDLHGNG